MCKLVRLTDTTKLYQVEERNTITPISVQCVIRPDPGVEAYGAGSRFFTKI